MRINQDNKIKKLPFYITFLYFSDMEGNLRYPDQVRSAWDEVIAKPKWYAGIKTRNDTFYSAPKAFKLKEDFREGRLSLKLIFKVLEAHGFEIDVSVSKKTS